MITALSFGYLRSGITPIDFVCGVQTALGSGAKLKSRLSTCRSNACILKRAPESAIQTVDAMGFSHAFGCFKDPEARALKKQKKARKRARTEEALPNRVVAAAGRGGQAGIEMRNVSDRLPLSTTTTSQNFEPPPSSPGDDELEPWSVGAVIRRTSMLQARLAEAANERKQTEEDVDVPNSESRYQATVEEDVEAPTIETKSEVNVEEKEDKRTNTGETTSTPIMESTSDRGGEGSGVRATMMFGVPTTKREPGVDLRAIEEEAEIRKFTEENNALAGKGSHGGKYGGAVDWNPAYNQRPAPIPLQGRDTRTSGWGRSGWGGSFGAAVDEPYYDYELGASNGSTRSPTGSNPYGSPYGYGRKANSPYGFMSGPAN